MNIENNMISMLFLILKFLTIFPYLAIYSEPLCATYVSFGGGGSHITSHKKLFEPHFVGSD